MLAVTVLNRSHVVTIEDTRIKCKGCSFSAGKSTWGPRLAFRMAHLHVAMPDKSSEELLRILAGES